MTDPRGRGGALVPLSTVERFSLDPDKMQLTRSYTAEDPVYFKGQFAGSDVIGVADLPYKPDPCKELGFLDYSKDAKKSRLDWKELGDPTPEDAWKRSTSRKSSR
jgi:hypothetical protein